MTAAVLDPTIPAGLNRYGQSPDEARQHEAMEAARVQLLLMQRMPIRIPVHSWNIRGGINDIADRTPGIEIHLGVLPSDHASRATVMGLAEQFGLTYTEEPHGGGKNIVTADGVGRRHPNVQVGAQQMVPLNEDGAR